MSEIYIHYGNIQDSIDKAKAMRDRITDYKDELKKRIRTPISELPGSDSSGYTSTASSLALEKMTALTEKSERFKAYEKAAGDLASLAKRKDQAVSSRIETITDAHIARRTWYQKFGDWVYNTFCVTLPNKWGWTESVMTFCKKVCNQIGDWMEPVIDWFKYGAGKYVLNIVMSVVSIVLAVAATVAAIAAIPFTGGASAATIPVILGIITAAATSISGLITLFNSASKMKANAKALMLYEENPGAARYYGSISTVSDEWGKTDKGGAGANKAYDIAGKAIDTTKVVADVTVFVTGIAQLGTVRDYRFKDPHKQIKGYDFSKKNVTKNIQHNMGLYTSKLNKKKVPFTQKVNWKKALDVKGSILATSKGKYMVGGELVISEGLFRTFQGARIIKNVSDLGKHVSTINSTLRTPGWGIEEVSEVTEAVTGVLSHSKLTGIFDTYGTKTGKQISSMIKDGADWYACLAK